MLCANYKLEQLRKKQTNILLLGGGRKKSDFFPFWLQTWNLKWFSYFVDTAEVHGYSDIEVSTEPC